MQLLRGRSTSRPALRSRGAATVRCEATKVVFKVQRHVEFGQSVALIGSQSQLGSWDAASAPAMQWSAGDVWTAELEFPSGSAVEYKYIIKRKDGVDWAPGDNKSVTLPPAAAVEIMDSWTDPKATTITPAGGAAASKEAAAAAPAPAATPAAATPVVAAAEAEATPVVAATAAEEDSPVTVLAESNGNGNGHVAVSTIENVEAEVQLPVSEAPSKTVANNIVQGIPSGATPVGQQPAAADESGKLQVMDVRPLTGAVAAAAAADALVGPQSLDHLTVAELKSELKRRGLPPMGNRRELITRLQESGAI